MKTLPRNLVTLTIHMEQDDSPVRGNASASGDDEYDKLIEDGILERLRQDDDWAWCCVTVTGKFGPFTADTSLYGCSYNDKEDFMQPGGYYDEMVDEVIEDLERQIERALQLIQSLPDKE